MGAAALRSKLGVALGATPPAGGAPPPTWSKAAPKPPPAGLSGEDLAARLRSQLLNRPELRNALEEARAQLSEASTDVATEKTDQDATEGATSAPKASEEPKDA